MTRAFTTIRVEDAVLDAVRRHAHEQPRREICGVLLGAWGPPVTILDTVRGTNLLRAPDRYLLDAASLLAADDIARARGVAVVGFYHSHPDHVPIPSPSDRATAWHSFVYLIAGTSVHHAPALCAWTIDGAHAVHPLLIDTPVVPRSTASCHHQGGA